jgi:hypothetical protein
LPLDLDLATDGTGTPEKNADGGRADGRQALLV